MEVDDIEAELMRRVEEVSKKQCEEFNKWLEENSGVWDDEEWFEEDEEDHPFWSLYE